MTAIPAQADMFVILGATGDLAQRMLFPSLYFLDSDGFLPAGMRLLGVARGQVSREAFLDAIRLTTIERAKPASVDPVAWERFAARVDYCSADVAKPEGAAKLKSAV